VTTRTKAFAVFLAWTLVGLVGVCQWYLLRLSGGIPLHWGGFLAGVGDGDAYMFFVEGIGNEGWKRDSYARELTLSPAFPDNQCVVRDPQRYPWHDEAWQPPGFNDYPLSASRRHLVGTRRNGARCPRGARGHLSRRR